MLSLERHEGCQENLTAIGCVNKEVDRNRFILSLGHTTESQALWGGGNNDWDAVFTLPMHFAYKITKWQQSKLNNEVYFILNINGLFYIIL